MDSKLLLQILEEREQKSLRLGWRHARSYYLDFSKAVDYREFAKKLDEASNKWFCGKGFDPLYMSLFGVKDGPDSSSSGHSDDGLD